MVDVHCHLDMKPFKADLPQVLDRAWKAGLEFVVTVGVEEESARRCLALAEGRRIYVSIGVHPHYAQGADRTTFRTLEALARHSKVKAIGETGLDLYRKSSSPSKQKEAFRRHLHLAHKLDLPVVIHCREAAEEVLKVLDEEGLPAAGGMVHCFSEDLATAREFLKRGLYLSFSGVLTYPRAEPLREVAKEVPRGRLLVETDAPYLAPVPHRGRRNEPALVAETLKALAELRGLPLEEMGEVVVDNARRLLRIGKGGKAEWTGMCS